jgi:hypothetical protein
MPHDMPQDWKVALDSVPLLLFLCIVVFPLLFYLFFRGLEPAEAQVPNAAGVIVSGVMIFAGCPLIAFSLMFLLSGLSFSWLEFQMHLEGKLAATGVVREKVIRNTYSEGGAATAHRWLLIEFRDNEGRLHQVEREVDEQSWKRHGAGSRLPDIEYLQSAPTTWRFAAETGLWATLLFNASWYAAVVIALRVICGLLLRGMSRPNRRREAA